MSRQSVEIAAANQRAREARDELEKLQQEIALPLRAKVVELEREVSRLRERADTLIRERDTYKDAWRATMQVVHLLDKSS